jgi:hypothetical protein
MPYNHYALLCSMEDVFGLADRVLPQCRQDLPSE